MKTDGSVSRWCALGTSAGLSVLFLTIYGGALWITSLRHDVGVFYFAWERAIPFVPFMILPYLSIDLFFVAAPFLFRRRRDLSIYAWRVAVAIMVAGVFFLLIPLRFAFVRPVAEGWLGAVFEEFRGLDAPFNLCPSLHAALLVFLADAYARHLRGMWRGVVLGWFGLIALSPLLTKQHHVIDILAGFALAGLCCGLVGGKFWLASPEPKS